MNQDTCDGSASRILKSNFKEFLNSRVKAEGALGIIHEQFLESLICKMQSSR
jgi:hypothetical protein